MSTKQYIWRKFHSYDYIPGIHKRLRQYIIDNGDDHIDYFIAHLSHEVYKTRGMKGHLGRQNIRRNLKSFANDILITRHQYVPARIFDTAPHKQRELSQHPIMVFLRIIRDLLFSWIG